MIIGSSKPDGFAMFCYYASRLFAKYDIGGPLHVELDDHETYLLTGEHAERNLKIVQAAIHIIVSGKAPDEPPTQPGPDASRWDDEYLAMSEAHIYRDDREALMIAVSLLSITRTWSELQAETAYAMWERSRGGEPCGCQYWPEGFADD